MFDQFISIAKHHQDIHTGTSNMIKDEYSNDPIIMNKTQTENQTRSILVKQDDWKEWEKTTNRSI